MPSEGAGQRGRAAQLLVLPVTEAEGSVCGSKPFYSASTADTSTGAEVEFQPMGGGSRMGRHQPSKRGTESRTEEAHTDPASLSARPSRPRADILMPVWPGVRWIQQEPSPQVPGLGLLLLLSLLRPLRFQRWCPSVLLRHRAMQSPGGRWEGRLGGSRSPRLCPFFALLFQK